MIGRGGVSEGLSHFLALCSKRELENVIDCIKDQALQFRLEKTQSIHAFRQRVGLILSHREAFNVDNVPISYHDSSIVVTVAVAWGGEDRYAGWKL